MQVLAKPIPIRNPYLEFEQRCLEIKPEASKLLKQHASAFTTSSEQIHDEIINFHNELSQITLLSVLLTWAKKIGEDRVLGKRYLEIMRELISLGLLPVLDRDNSSLLETYVKAGHDAIINRIRSHSSWFLQKREDAVSLYVTFSNWASEYTVGFIKTAVDPDRVLSSKRRLSYEKYIELLTVLPRRERIITKLFYLGGARSLEDILALKIDSLNFSQGCIHFARGPIQYPLHVLEDITTYLDGRRKGFVFSNNLATDRIHHTVPYRSMKKAAQKIGLPSSFSYKDLISDS